MKFCDTLVHESMQVPDPGLPDTSGAVGVWVTASLQRMLGLGTRILAVVKGMLVWSTHSPELPDHSLGVPLLL